MQQPGNSEGCRLNIGDNYGGTHPLWKISGYATGQMQKWLNCVIGLPFYIGKTLSYTQQFKSRSRDCNCWGPPSLKGLEIPNYEYFYKTAITLIRSIGPKGASCHCQIWCFCPPCITIILKYNTPLATPLNRNRLTVNWRSDRSDGIILY